MKIVAVASGKGGVGKSCVAAYTGGALAKAGKKVLLVELGHDPRSLDLILGVPDSSLFHIGDVLSGRSPVEKAIVPTRLQKQLDLLPAQTTSGVPRVAPEDFARLMATIPRDYDYIFFDGVDYRLLPPTLFDTILAIVTPDSLSLRAASMLVRELYDGGASSVRLVINNVPPEVLPMYGAEDFDDVIDLVGAQLIAVIPRSPKLQYASNNAELISEESLAPQIFDRLALRLEGHNSPLLIR